MIIICFDDCDLISSPENLLIDSKGVVVKEWWVASQHLVEEDTKGPPDHELMFTEKNIEYVYVRVRPNLR